MRTGFLWGAIGPLLGAFFFFAMFDAKILNPTYVGWLFSNQDSANAFLGWQFFQHEPWHMPIGAATRYGMEMGSAIVFTDSIPLFAIVLKAFGSLLPVKFQYVGLWILACYLAQGFMAWLLSGLITRRVFQRSMIVAFFVIVPIMLDRAVAHHALMAHWLVLGALYLCLKPYDSRTNRWFYVLLALAALVHAYLLFMACAVWSAHLARRWLDHDMTATQVSRSAVIVAGTLVCTMWLAGYFTLPTNDFQAGAEQYGRFAANLKSFWNPLWLPTRFLSPRPVVPGSELEGSNYLGVGIFVMLACGVVALIRLSADVAAIRSYLPLIVVAVLLWVLALSNQIAWGDRILITIPLPERLLHALSALRASGRLLWIGYYCILIAALAAAARRFRPATATVVLFVGLMIQVADLSPRYADLKRDFHKYFIIQPNERQRPLQSPFWEIAGRHYRNILFVPMAQSPKGYDVFAPFAADRQMSINVGYFARVSSSRIQSANERLELELAKGGFREDSLYVLWNEGTPQPGRLGSRDAAGVVDTYSVIAPGWFEFADCCAEGLGVLRAGQGQKQFTNTPITPDLSVGSLPFRLEFGRTATRKLMQAGWGQDEFADGQTWAWSNGASSVLQVPLPVTSDIQMEFECKPFLFPGHPEQKILLLLNGKSIEKLWLRPDRQTYSVILRREALMSPLNTIELRYAYVRRPQDVLSNSPDNRSLAVAWYWIEFSFPH